jgi:3-phosphoshikimate 1-carboxyvinyltransferase
MSDTRTPAGVIDTAWVEVVPGGPVRGAIRPPGSKSLTNRALLCAALAEGPSRLSGALDSEDTRVMVDALRRVGIDVRFAVGAERIELVGCGGRLPEAGPRSPIAGELAVPPPPTISLRDDERPLFIANSGTTIRFLTAALSALGGNYLLYGVPRMHERPIGDLVAALAQLGTAAETLSPGGCPPVRIGGRGWQQGRVGIAGDVSSQYLSGLLMAAPASGREVQISVRGELVSRPYVEMTAAVMASFGVAVGEPVPGHFRLAGPQSYRGCEYQIEPDASAASYPWAAAAISGGEVTVAGLSRGALQGDVRFVEVLEQMGCRVVAEEDRITVRGGSLRGIDVDMNAISDCVQTLAVVALFADGPTTVRGVAHNRFKETDRIADLARELRKLGAKVEERHDGMTITPGELRGATLQTYHDHRMAMSLALVGLRVPGVRILDPACTAKTYPHYFADLEGLLGRSHRWAD